MPVATSRSMDVSILVGEGRKCGCSRFSCADATALGESPAFGDAIPPRVFDVKSQGYRRLEDRPLREASRAFVPRVRLEHIQEPGGPIFQRQRIQEFDGLWDGRDAHVIWLLAC